VKRLYHKEDKKWVRTGWAMEEFSYVPATLSSARCTSLQAAPHTPGCGGPRRDDTGRRRGTVAGQMTTLTPLRSNHLPYVFFEKVSAICTFGWITINDTHPNIFLTIIKSALTPTV
jgi:hypothetical protein